MVYFLELRKMTLGHVIYFYLIELAKTEDALRPFVLACETKQIKLVTIAIGCIQKLISFHAIPEVKEKTEYQLKHQLTFRIYRPQFELS